MKMVYPPSQAGRSGFLSSIQGSRVQNLGKIRPISRRPGRASTPEFGGAAVTTGSGDLTFLLPAPLQERNDRLGASDDNDRDDHDDWELADNNESDDWDLNLDYDDDLDDWDLVDDDNG